MSVGFTVLNVPVASLLQNFEGFLAFGVMSRWRNSLPEAVAFGTKATGDTYHDWLQAAHSNQHLTNQRQAFIFKNTVLMNR